MKRMITPGVGEVILFCITFALVLLGILFPHLRPTIKSIILFPIYIWAISALFGFLVSNAKHIFTVFFGGRPEKNEPGVPFLVSLISKGGYICQSPITVKAKVVDIESPNKKGKANGAKKIFKERFEEFNIVWFFSQSYKKKKNGFLKG